jgi:ABC-2 type transport system permease protein
MMRLLRSAFVIGRRDFGATVLSKTFIFFLLGPVFPLLLGGVFGSIGSRVATQTEQPVIAVVSSSTDFSRMETSRDRVSDAMPGPGVVRLVHYDPEPDLTGQGQRLLNSRHPPVRAVLTGGLANPHLTGAVDDDANAVGQLKLILADARSSQPKGATLGVTKVRASTGALVKDRALTAQIGQMLLFFLTLLLSGMVMSQLVEEKSNKIIEVIAAAVPIESMFIGKLFAMLAASIVGIIVWVSAGALLVQMVKTGGVATLPPPSVGWPVFLALGIVYFGTYYLLLGAVFLMIGALASTVREVQTLSMPVTFAQVVIFGFAATAIGAPDSTKALIAAIFPWSSPMTMLARAAEQPELWPHLVALVWQALWVALTLRLGAQLFRKTVLKSGPRRPWWKLSRV